MAAVSLSFSVADSLMDRPIWLRLMRWVPSSLVARGLRPAGVVKHCTLQVIREAVNAGSGVAASAGLA
jgi:hypothetical protein